MLDRSSATPGERLDHPPVIRGESLPEPLVVLGATDPSHTLAGVLLNHVMGHLMNQSVQHDEIPKRIAWPTHHGPESVIQVMHDPTTGWDALFVGR
jgi:hypothetical protein